MGVDYDPQIAKWAAEHDAIQQRAERVRMWNAYNRTCGECDKCRTISDIELQEFKDKVAFCVEDFDFVNPEKHPCYYGCELFEGLRRCAD